MCSTFLQILSIFSSPEGYRLQFSIPSAYFVYTVWHCTDQHCSSVYSCTYLWFTSTWRPLMSAITTFHYVVISFHQVWYHVLSLRYACIRSSDIILIHWATFVPNFISFTASTAELGNGEKSRTQSLTHPARTQSLTQLS